MDSTNPPLKLPRAHLNRLISKVRRKQTASGTTPLAPIPVTIRHRASCSMDCAVAVNIACVAKAARVANMTR